MAFPSERELRRDISVQIVPTKGPGDLGQFKVSFQSSDPRLSQRVTERMASIFIEENLRDREAGLVNQTRTIPEDQFTIVQAPLLPSRPAGPNRIAVSLLGALAGLTISLALAGVRRPTAAV